MGKQHQGCGEMVKQTSEYLHPYGLWNHDWGLQQGKLDFFKGLFSKFLPTFCFHNQKKNFGNQFADAVVAGRV